MKPESGTRGQNEFVGWCEPEQFHVQRSDPDRLGWDFLLEADPDRYSERPLDQQNELPKFLVQVKATEHATKGPRIKLSALKHLVDSDLPAAIAILFYAKGGRRSVRRLIVPVDEPLIASTLRQVREQEAKGNRDIHNVKVTIPTDRSVEIGAGGEGLSDVLHRMLNGTLTGYIAKKMHFRQTCGFDDGPSVGRFFIPGLDARERFGDLFLGGRRELAVQDLTIERRRFGIPLSNDVLSFRDAVLDMDAPPLLSASVELASKSGEWLSLAVDAYIIPPLTDDPTHAKMRLANSFFELVLDYDKEWAGITFDYNSDRKVDLEEAVSIIEVGALLARPEKTLTIHFNDHCVPLPAADEIGPFQNWIPVAPVIRRICQAIQRSPRRPHRALQLGDWINWVDKHKELLALASTPGANLFFPRWPEDAVVDGQEVILTAMTVEIAGLQYTALVEVPIISVTRGEQEVHIVGGQPHVVDEAVRAPGANTSDFINLAVEASKRRRGATGPALVAGGIEKWESATTQVTE